MRRATGIRRKRAKLRASAGFDLSAWVQDILRHTAGSNHVVRIGEAVSAGWAGHSIAVLHAHYCAVVKKGDAEPPGR